MKDKKAFDVIVIGGSYSGLAAAMALGRASKTVLVIDSGKPCNRQTPHSHNFLTQDGQAPAEIAAVARKEVAQYSTVEFWNGKATMGRPSGNMFEIETDSGVPFTAKKLVFAAGIKDRLPDIPGLRECWGISALHCPYCHGYEVKGEKTGILANGEHAFEMAKLISNWTAALTVYTNGRSTLSPEQKAQLVQHNISINESEVAHLEHKAGYLSSIIFENGVRAYTKALYVKAPFEQHSLIPQSLGCELTDEAYIKVDAFQETTIPGIYACGDSTNKMRTVANAVATGTTAGMAASKKLIFEEF
jgi:thioredoxin reductase